MMSPGDYMATTENALVVADAGPLIHLDELSALDVLSDYSAVLVPDAVWSEVAHHRPQALHYADSHRLQRVTSKPSAKVAALTVLYTLHRGEMEALALCLNRSVNVLLTDDTAARLAAKNLDLVTHGTLGLLIRAVRRGHRTADEVLKLLAAIPTQTTLHIRSSLLAEVIERVRQEWAK